MRRASIVDLETGEIVDEINQGDRILRKQSKEFLDENIQNFNSEEHFIKIFTRNAKKISKVLSVTEAGMLLMIAPYISYNDCILRNGGHHNGEILTAKALSELINCNYKTFNRVFNSLLKKGVVGIHTTGSLKINSSVKKAITVNPYIFCKGNTINKTIIGLYDNSWKDYLDD